MDQLTSRTLHTAQIVSAFVHNNHVPAADLPGLISAVGASIGTLITGPAVVESQAVKPVPAVPISKSITPDYLISLEDGSRYKSLKRHLGSRGLTPDQYRAKWGLPSDYPMVAPSYAKQRSELAKQMGLGRRDEPAAAQGVPRRKAA
jgi:predicted transcriptional regulator